jgi:hypothetical protein
MSAPSPAPGPSPARGDAPEREWIGEPIEPDPSTFQAQHAANGEPARPTRFAWRGRTFEIAAVERAWKTTDALPGGGGVGYVRKHWLDVRTTDGASLRIYADRGSRYGARTARWWLHSRTR